MMWETSNSTMQWILWQLVIWGNRGAWRWRRSNVIFIKCAKQWSTKHKLHSWSRSIKWPTKYKCLRSSNLIGHNCNRSSFRPKSWRFKTWCSNKIKDSILLWALLFCVIHWTNQDWRRIVGYWLGQFHAWGTQQFH